ENRAINPDAICDGSKYRLRIRTIRPLSLILEQGVMHLPVMSLFTCGFRCFGGSHRIRMDADQWKMMKLETDLVRIPVQYFFHKRMICRATGALVIAKLHQSQFCVFRPAEVAAAFDVRRQWSGCTARHRLVGLTTQKHCSTGCNGNGEKDDDHRLDGFWHALIVAQALLSVR